MASPYHPLTLHPQDAKIGHRYVWELPIRYYHLVMACSITTLLVTGFFISYPVFGPNGGEPFDHFVMGRFRQVHLAAGWLLFLAYMTRVYWYFMGNKYARSGTAKFWDPNWYKLVFGQIVEYMKVERGHAHLGHNSLAGASYVFMVGGVGMFQIITGFAMLGENNVGGFWDKLCGWVIPILGGSYRTHLWHHFASWVFIIFVIVHLYMTIFGSIRFQNGLVSSIVSGDKFYREGDIDYD